MVKLVPDFFQFLETMAEGMGFFFTRMDAFGQPRCLKDAIHGAKVGAWVYRAGKKITIWERITP